MLLWYAFHLSRASDQREGGGGLCSFIVPNLNVSVEQSVATLIIPSP